MDMSKFTDEQLVTILSDENKAWDIQRQQFKARVALIKEEQAKRAVLRKLVDMPNVEREQLRTLLGAQSINPPVDQVPTPK